MLPRVAYLCNGQSYTFDQKNHHLVTKHISFSDMTLTGSSTSTPLFEKLKTVCLQWNSMLSKNCLPNMK